MVWGEHGGILRHYRRALERYEEIPKNKVNHRNSAAPGGADDWTALANPMNSEDYLHHLRTHVSTMFRIDPAIRWGFKEIHYHEAEDAEFLIRLFPNCRIAFLQRNPVDMFISQYFVHWNASERAKGLSDFSQEFAKSYSRTIGNFARVSSTFTNAMIVDVDRLTSGEGHFQELIEFLGLPRSSFDQKELDDVFLTTVGSSFGRGKTRKGIEASPEDITKAREAIGMALARLGIG